MVMLKELLIRSLAWLPLLSVSGQGFALDLHTVCEAARQPGFDETLAYMSQGGETCTLQNCHEGSVVLAEKVYFEVAVDTDDNRSLPAVADAARAASTIIGDTTGVKFSSDFAGAGSFVFVLIVSRRTAEMIADGQFSEVDGDHFRSFILPALQANKCAGIVSHFSDGTRRIVEKSLIFVPDSLRADADIRACIFEEFLNTSGLLRDPPGYASLFDYGNYRSVDGLKSFSETTLAMLKLHYDIARETYVDVEDFRTSECSAGRD